MSRRARPRAAGFTLIEIVVSTAILGFLAVVLLSAFVPVTNQSNERLLAVDMDRVASTVLSEIRRDLRQSGYDGTAKFGQNALDDGLLVTAKTQIMFQQRVDATTWGPTQTWRLNGTNAQRSFGGSFLNRGFMVSNLTFTVTALDHVCRVELTLSNTIGTMTRSYVDQVEMMNR